MSCSQLNGSPYHLNHLRSIFITAPPPHTSYTAAGSAAAVSGPAKVHLGGGSRPDLQWMQVKKNVLSW